MSVDQLRQAFKEQKFTYGGKETIKKIKLGKVSTVFLASDCKDAIKERVQEYKKQGKLTLIELNIKGTEIGTICKKQFPISILSY